MSRYRFIEAQRNQYPARLLCQVVTVPVSGYYAWQKVQEQADVKHAAAWEQTLVKVFGRHKRRYGMRRLLVALRRKGYRVGCQRLPAHRYALTRPARAATKGLYPVHDRLDAWAALRSEPATQPAQAYPG